MDKFGGIIAPAGNTKLGKLAEQCAAGYIPSRNSFLINRKTLKDIKTAKAHFAEERKLVSDFLNYPEKFNKDKIPQIVRSILDGSKESGRSLVAENITDTINHELGHMLERKVTASQLWKISEKNMKNYATKVSGYATSSKGEYLAESFASFLKGEDVIDPNLKKLFESFEKR